MTTVATAGPWSWQEQDGTDMPILRGPNGESICDFGSCRQYYPSEGTPPDEADRALIAAAPDLLAALRDVISWVPGATAWHTDAPLKAVENARTVIAKATGSAA